MSAPQPPNQPWGGGQPPQGPPSGAQPQQDSPFGSAEPTQVVQPAQPHQGDSPFGEPEPTQVVQPGQPGEGGAGATQAMPPVDANATQMVNPFGGDAPVAESTQLVPPGSQPPAIPYTPPPSAADNPAAAFGQPGGYGQPGQPGQPGGFGQQQGFGPPGQPPQGFGGYGGPQQPGFGGPQQPFGAAPSGGNAQMLGYVAAGLLAVFGLLALVFFFVDMFDSNFSDYADAVGKATDQEVQAAKDAGRYISPGLLTVYYIAALVGALATLAAAVFTFLKNKIAAFLAAGGGFVLLLAGILIMLELSIDLPKGVDLKFGNGQVLYLIAGIFVLAIGVLGILPNTAQFVGLGGGTPGGPQQQGFSGPPQGFGGPQQGFGGPPQGYGGPQQQGGYGQPQGYPQQPPQGYGPPPGQQGPPSGGFGQPGGPNPASGGFPQPSSGGFPQPGQPPQPGGYGQPGQPPYGYPQQPGQPPQGYGPPPGQQGPPSGGFGQPGQPPQQPW